MISKLGINNVGVCVRWHLEQEFARSTDIFDNYADNKMAPRDVTASCKVAASYMAGLPLYKAEGSIVIEEESGLLIEYIPGEIMHVSFEIIKTTPKWKNWIKRTLSL